MDGSTERWMPLSKHWDMLHLASFRETYVSFPTLQPDLATHVPTMPSTTLLPRRAQSSRG